MRRRQGTWGTDDDRSLRGAGVLTEALGAFAFSDDRARAYALADVLAWAVSRGRPLPEALRTLVAPGARKRAHCARRRPSASYWRQPICLGLQGGEAGWRIRICGLADALELGRPLGAALKRYVGTWLPGYFVIGVTRAERDNRLAAALPVLAAELKRPVSLLNVYRQYVLVVFWRLTAVGLLLGFLGAKVAPRIIEIWAELAGQAGPFATMAMPDGRVLPAVVILAWIGLRLAPRLGRFGEWLVLPLPLLGQVWRRCVLADFAQGMVAFLRQGDDIVAAVEWSRQATRSRWMERRLKRFMGALRKGTPWLTAWEQAGIGWTFERWVLCNAAAREEPADGFALVAEWQQRRIAEIGGRMRFWIEPLTVFALAGLIGYVAWRLFESLAGLIWLLST